MKKVINNNLVIGLVSVVIPVYNVEKFLKKSIESAINQSYKKIELILVNDGSIDNSGRICDEYVRNDKRIRVIHTKNNGPAAARNRGIIDSKGEFIFFLDSDDSIKNDAISSLVKSYNRYKADIIIGDFRKVDDSNSNSGHNRVFSDSKLLTKQDIIAYVGWYLKKPNKFPLLAHSWGKLFKSSIIKNNSIYFDTDLRTFEDVAFNFDYLNYTNKVFFLKETIYNHLIHNNYISATMAIGANPIKLFGYKIALTKIKDFLKNCNSNADIRKKIGHADVCFTIIQLVRICGQINNNNKKKIYKLINEIISDSNFRNNLQSYSPSKDDSRILPLLMKLKLILPIIWICKYKARKRYKKS